MKFRAAGIVAVALLLCGCSDADWNNLLSFGSPSNTDVADDQQAAPADTPAPPVEEAVAPPEPAYSVTTTVTTKTTAAASGYCRTAAQGTGADAARDGMDDAEQQHVADVAYRQCLALYGSSGR